MNNFTFIKPLFFLLFSMAIFSFSHAQIASTCANSDFEQGGFAGWQGSTGSCCPVNTPTNGIVAGRHTIMTGAGTDPLACNNITYVAPGGTYSARLGNSNTGAQAERLRYTVPITASNTLFIYKYAVVLQDPGHSASQQPRFELKILDGSGQVVDPVCGQYSVVASGSIPGFQSCGSTRYKPWTTVGMDMTPYIGQNITMEFSTGDCSAGAHYGYAYIDAYCSPLTINTDYCMGAFSATLTAPLGFSYLWNTGETTQIINVSNPVSGQTYTCQLTSVTGCQVLLSSVLEPVNPDAGFIFNTNCFNNAVFTDTSFTPGTTTITTWQWDFGDGNTSAFQHPVHSYGATGNYNVQLIVTNSSGCVDTVTHQVIANPVPVADFNFIPVCEANSVVFTDASLLGSAPISSWQWDFDDGSPLDNNQNTSHVYFTAGTYNVTLAIIDTNGCSDFISKQVVISPIPVVDFNFTNQCQGTPISFSDNSTVIAPNYAVSWAWNFGDGNIATGSSTSHNYTSGGTYNVTLLVTTDAGCIDSITKVVNVFFNPNVGFTHNDVCLGDPINFIDTSWVNAPATLSNYLWAFGDGSPTSNLVNPTHLYSSAGIYTVTLIVTTDSGCSYVANVDATVFALPVSSFTVNDECLSDPAIFTNTSGGSIDSWKWNFGDGSPLDSSLHPVHSYASAGTYTVTLISYSIGNCTDTAIATIEIFPMPVADFSFTNECLNAPMSFIDLSQGNNTNWAWDFNNDGITDNTTANPSHIYTTPGNHNVTLTVTTSDGCSNSVVKNVTVYPLPVTLFSAASVCFGSNTIFQNTSYVSPPDTIQYWRWNFDNGSPLNNTKAPVYQYSAPGTYDVQLHVTSFNGCTDSLTLPITVHPNPVVDFISDTVGCAVFCVNFQDLSTVATGSNQSWLWDFGDGVSSNLSNPDHCFKNNSNFLPVKFPVKLTVTSNEGCVSMVNRNNYITVNPLPVADFNFTPQPTTIENPNIYFKNLSIGSQYWDWDFGDAQGISNEQNPYYTYKDTGQFVVRLICENNYGCTDTTEKTVLIGPDWIIYIPNAFTPNGDVINDFFSAKGYGILEFEMMIFDRWGEMIFNTTNMEKGWDGSYRGNGAISQQDVYIYIIKIRDVHGKPHKYQGTVTIVR